MAYVCHGDVFRTGSGKPVQGSWDGVWSMWVEGSFVFGHCAFDGDCSVDVANVDQLIISEVLSIAVVGPAIHQLLPGDLAQEFIRVVNDEWDLDVLRDVPSFFDLGVAILQDSGL